MSGSRVLDMPGRRRRRHARGQAMVEFALIGPLAFLLLIGTVILGVIVLHEIQLSADLMVTIAKAARRLYPQELPPRVRGILERMGEQAQVQMRAAVDAFADGDLALAGALPDMDDAMDDLQKDLFRAILTPERPDEGTLQRAVQMALVGRYYERVADHAVQIGRWVAFMVTGDLPRPGDDQPASV
jgi:phosphate transport system protein